MSLDEIKYSDFNDEQLGELLDKGVFDYEGYNPEVTYNTMKKKEPNEKRLVSEIRQICYFYIIRGKKVQKATQKMSEDGRSIINKLKAKYTILDTVPTRKEDITIPRIAGISPVYCAQILKNGKGRVVGDVPEGLNVALCFPQAASIIPHDREDVYKLWLKWSHSFNKIINQGKKDSDVDMYAKVVWDAGYYTEHQRSDSFRSLGI